MNYVVKTENINIKLNKIHDYLASFLVDTSELKKPSKDPPVNENEKLQVCRSGSSSKRQLVGKITQPNSIHDFQERLSSFKYGSWNVPGLSPILCARFGWKLKRSNMLQCVTCQALICTTLPPASQYDAYTKFLNHLKERVNRGHFDWCGWTCNQCPEEFACPALGFSVFYLESLKKDIKAIMSLDVNLPLINTQSILQKMNLIEWQLHIFFEIQDSLDEEQLTAVLLALTGWKLEKKLNLRCNVCLRNIGLWNFVSLKKKEEYLRLKERREQKLKRIEIQLASKKAKELENKKREACKKKLEEENLKFLMEEKRKANEIAEKEAADEEARRLKREERRKSFEEVNYEQLIDQHINEVEDEVDEKEEKYLLGEVDEILNVPETDLKNHDKMRGSDFNQYGEVAEIQTFTRNLECCQENVSDDILKSGGQLSNHSDNDKCSNNKLNIAIEEAKSPNFDVAENNISEVDNIKILLRNEYDSSKSSNDCNSSSDDDGNTKNNDEDDLWLEAVGCDKVKMSSSSVELCTEYKSKEITSGMKRKQSFDSDSDTVTSSDDLSTNKSNDLTYAKKRRKSSDNDSNDTVKSIKENSFSSSDELKSNSKNYEITPALKCKQSSDNNLDSSFETPEQIAEQISEVLNDGSVDKIVIRDSLEEEITNFCVNKIPVSDVELVNPDVSVCEQFSDSEEVEELNTDEDHLYEKMTKSFFDPFEEHRSWCGWISQCSANGIECIEKRDLLGYLVLPQQLKHILPQSPRLKGNLLTSETYIKNVEGLREIRSTLYEWQLEDVEDADVIVTLDQSSL